MEETSNGKLEEALEVEGRDEEQEVVLKEDLEDPKPELESLKDVIADEGNSELVNDAYYSSSGARSSDEGAEVSDKSPEVENPENREVIAEPVVSLSDDLTEEKKTSPALDGNDGASHVVTDFVENGFEEKEKAGLSSDETSAVSAVVADEEIKDQPSNEVPPAPVDVVSKGIEETEVSILNESIGESSVSHDLESKEVGYNSLQASADAVVESTDLGQVGNKPDTPESTGNPPIISVARHPLQPTSWRSCCGLFEVFRRHS